jgi:hypothetical protein
MEYLMTYGWAILIIAVVLGMLFQMGVFSTKSYSPTVQAGSCRVLRTATTASLAGVCASQLPKYVAQVNGQSYISAPSTGFPTITSSSGAVTVSGWVYLTSSSSSIFAINLYTPSFLAFIDVDGCTVGIGSVEIL